MPANVVSMAYVGETPWHGMGTKVPSTITDEEMVKAAGLDWEMAVSPMIFEYEGKRYAIRNEYMLHRKDRPEDQYGTVGRKYVPFQNREILHFFREFVATGDMTLETAGSLDGGRYIWAMAKLGSAFVLPGSDKVEGYVLLMNPHEYGRGLIVKMTQIRVVCQNTMNAALAGAGDSLKIWHTAEFNDVRQAEAKIRLGLAKEKFEQAEETALKLSFLPLTEEQAIGVTARTFKHEEDADKPREEQSRVVKRVLDLYDGEGMGASLKSAAGTGWGLLNAVTQYIDWEYGRTPDKRLVNSWIGGNDVTKRRAQKELVALAAAQGIKAA